MPPLPFPSLSLPSLSLPPRSDFLRQLAACVFDASGGSVPASPTSSSSQAGSPMASASSPRSTFSRPAALSRPAWLNASWLAASAASAASASGGLSRNDEAENQERHDRCALHFSRAAASNKIAGDIVASVELAFSTAFGAAVPVQFARELSAMKRASEQCHLALEWLTPFGDAPLEGARAQRPVSTADLDYARQSAQRATRAAMDCSKRLFALTEIADANSPVAAHGLSQPEAGSTLNASHIDKALRVIASDEFQHRLTSGLSVEQQVQRGLHHAGSVLQHAASDAVEWLLPTMKTENPAVYAQQIADLIPKARTTATIDWVAQPRFEEAQRCLGRSLLYAPRASEARNPAEHAAYEQRIAQMRDQSNMLYRQINDAAKVTARMVSRDASQWRHISHARRDNADATVQHDKAVAALPRLEALLKEAKKLPNAIAPHHG